MRDGGGEREREGCREIEGGRENEREAGRDREMSHKHIFNILHWYFMIFHLLLFFLVWLISDKK